MRWRVCTAYKREWNLWSGDGPIVAYVRGYNEGRKRKYRGYIEQKQITPLLRRLKDAKRACESEVKLRAIKDLA